MAAQIDLTPASIPPGLTVHVPNGQSASLANNPSDVPSPANVGTTNKAVTVKISGTLGSVVRFSNPS